MSRLDSFIRRLEAQRACLDHAAELIGGLDGVVLELGLGNGRTYDHLRSLFPGREIYVCERAVAAHPDCVPPEERLYTWWSYRARDWAASDRGRRLDHIWVTPPLVGALARAEVLRDSRSWQKASDHVPVMIELG